VATVGLVIWGIGIGVGCACQLQIASVDFALDPASGSAPENRWTTSEPRPSVPTLPPNMATRPGEGLHSVNFFSSLCVRSISAFRFLTSDHSCINVYKRLFFYKNAFLTFILFFQRFLFLKNVQLSL